MTEQHKLEQPKLEQPKLEQPNQLTRREKEIVEQLSFGYSAKEISEILFISELTVAKHKSNLLRKLNVSNTPHLVSVALREGLIC